MKSKSESANITRCLECGKKLPGRLGQKFCNPNCKAAYHYKKSKFKEPSTFLRIENQLKLNRRILKHINFNGKSEIDKEFLITVGFNFDYFTHMGEDKNGKLFYFYYEYGLHKLKGSGIYMLKIWKNYMKLKKQK